MFLGVKWWFQVCGDAGLHPSYQVHGSLVIPKPSCWYPLKRPCWLRREMCPFPALPISYEVVHMAPKRRLFARFLQHVGSCLRDRGV
jgi:hypothetical protein